MKAENLKKLKENGFNVPNFIIIEDEKEADLSFSDKSTFAVRSSFDIEDGDQKSYAGQFQTFLNIPKNEITAAVKSINESFPELNKKIIVQEMIESEFSGVVFTVNPLGILNEIVIVVGKGLGNNVVEDKINTTTYYYNTDDSLYNYEQNEESPVLTEELLKELIDIAGKVKTIFDKDMDIEFAIKDNTIYLLQARPITTLSNENVIILDNSNIVESYPGVSLPLTQSFVREIYYKIFKRLVIRIAGDEETAEIMDENLKNMVDVANGRIYYRISNWYSLLKLLPCSNKLIKVWQEMLGVRNKQITQEFTNVSIKTKLKVIYNFIKNLLKCPNMMNNLEKYFNSKIVYCWNSIEQHEAIDIILEKDSIESLLTLYEELKDDITSNWDVTLINDIYTFIFTALSGARNKTALSNIKNLESLKPVLKLNALFKLDENSEEFKKKFDDYIWEYGDRCLSELKLETKTYRTNPELLKEYLRNNHATPLKHIEFSYGKKTMNPFIRKARLGISNRESSRINRSRLFGVVREIFLRIGNILVKQNRLNAKEDVFYLFYHELEDKNLNYKELVEKRKLQYKEYEKIPGYSRFVFAGKVIEKQVNNLQTGVLSENNLYGTGTSEGIVEGKILVIDNPSIDINTTDKIIVTKMTDPGWVFLIKNCKGIIAERGSLLSHTAIISRELKKPAVVNVKNALKILKNGDQVKLDGIKGEIIILKRGE